MNKIILPTASGSKAFDTEKIKFCKAAFDGSDIYMEDGQKHHIKTNIANLDSILTEMNFFQFHSRFLINLNLMEALIPGNTFKIILSGGDSFFIPQRLNYKFINTLRRNFQFQLKD